MKQLKVLDDILAKEVTRKEFFVHIGLALLAVTGVSGMIKNLTSTTSHHSPTDYPEGSYGNSAYSGTPQKSKKLL